MRKLLFGLAMLSISSVLFVACSTAAPTIDETVPADDAVVEPVVTEVPVVEEPAVTEEDAIEEAVEEEAVVE